MKAKRMKQKENKSKINRKVNRNIGTDRTIKTKNTIKSKKIVLFFLVLIIIIGIIGFLVYNNFNKEESDPLLGDKYVFGMELTNISIENQSGVYVFKAQLKNTLKEKFESKPVQIVFRDESNQGIIKYQYTIDNLEKGQIQDIQIKTSKPLNEFYTFDVIEAP